MQSGVKKLGTILGLVENAMFRRLWERDFTVVTCGSSWQEQPAWMHDIVLDCMASGLIIENAACSFVLNPRYKSLLIEPQRRIRQALAPLHALMADEVVTTSQLQGPWKRIQQLLKEFGAPEFAREGEDGDLFELISPRNPEWETLHPDSSDVLHPINEASLSA